MIGSDACRRDVRMLANPGLAVPAATSRARAPAIGLTIIVLGALGATASLFLTGFQFGIINNLFHLPIVAALYDEPQFRNDMFIQSLRHYSSGVWILLDGAGRYIAPYWLFLALDYLSRLLCFVGFLCCGTLVGMESARERAVFVVILCFSGLLHGYSYPGNGGLFIDYFTHSEIANGTILLVIYFAARGRFTSALALTGVTFFVNAFMAVWISPSLGLIAAFLLRRGDLTVRLFVARATTGLVLAGVIASPVLWNMLHNPDFGASIGVDFRTYLREYYPDHVLFATASLRHMLALATATLYGFVCLALLGECATVLQAALWGSAVLYAVGIMVPLFTGLPLILSLHLIRSSAVIHLLVALASASLAARWLCGDDRNRAKFFGPLLVVADCTWRSVLPLGLVVLGTAEVLRRRGFRRPLVRLDLAVAVVLLTTIWPRVAWQDGVTNRTSIAQTVNWNTVGAWARANTPTDAVFLVPVVSLVGETSPPGVATAAPAPLQNSEIFEFASHRRVWVDFRRGAAVLWAPSYYAPWRARVSEVLALHSLAERIPYARQHDIDYVIDACGNGDDRIGAATFQAGGLCVYPASAGTASRVTPSAG